MSTLVVTSDHSSFSFLSIKRAGEAASRESAEGALRAVGLLLWQLFIVPSQLQRPGTQL
jgi:hypothetical protein